MPSPWTKLFLIATSALASMNCVSASPLNTLTRRVNGINCKGSIKCEGRSHSRLPDLQTQVNNITVRATQPWTYYAGDTITCGSGDGTGTKICLKVCENTPTFQILAAGERRPGEEWKQQTTNAGDILQDLLDNGCRVCGTAPVHREMEEGRHNRNDLGCLTVNYVKDGTLSPPTQGYGPYRLNG